MRKHEEPASLTTYLPLIILAVLAAGWFTIAQFGSDLIHLEAMRLSRVNDWTPEQRGDMIRLSYFMQGLGMAVVAAVFTWKEPLRGLLAVVAGLILCLLIQKWFRGMLVRPGTFEDWLIPTYGWTTRMVVGTLVGAGLGVLLSRVRSWRRVLLDPNATVWLSAAVLVFAGLVEWWLSGVYHLPLPNISYSFSHPAAFAVLGVWLLALWGLRRRFEAEI